MKTTANIKAAFAVLLAILVGSFAMAGTAQAQKVGNPGPIGFQAVGGYMKFGIMDPFNLEVDPDDPSSTITLNGTVDQNGQIVIPQASTEFPTFTLEDVAVVGNVDIKINSVGDIIGSVNPYTGATFVPVRLWIKVNSSSSLIGSGCALASASNPLIIDLTSGTSVPTGPGPTMTGIPYNPDTGLVTLVDGKVSAPASSGCGLAAGQLDGMIGLPAASGKNQISFQMRLTPTVTRGVTARVTAPNYAFDDQEITLDASTSTVAKMPGTYRWDFDNDGTWDTTPQSSPTINRTFTNSGNRTIKVRVTDPDGDSDEATTTVNIVRHSDLEIQKSMVGAFEVGTTPKYRLSVTNNSPDVAPFGTTVTDHVPDEFPIQGVDAPGWSCSVVGQDVSCFRQQIAGNSTADPIDITVGVTGDALPYKDNTATVSTPGDPVASNNSATVRSNVFAVDLTVKKSHDFEFRPGNDPKNVHVIQVRNRGTAPTANPTTVTDTLPAGLTPVSANGNGWNCNIAGQTVTCNTTDVIGAGDDAEPIEIHSSADIVGAGGEVGDTSAQVTNNVSVANSGDVINSNDTASDPTWIIDTPDLRIGKSHVGNFRAGTQADYTISVDNRGPQATTQTTTVVDVLPENLSYVDATGTGWTCSADEQTVTCEHTDPIAADSSADDITLTVDPIVPGEVTNVATVDNADDPNETNDTAQDPTSVRLIDLELSGEANEIFRVNRDAYLRLSLKNLGTSPTASASVITATLPAGVTYADWLGEGWNCNASAGSNVSCSYADPIEPDSPPNDLLLGVSLGSAALPSTSIDLHVATDDDYVPENDNVSVDVDVFAQDNAISLTHNGAFRAGVTRSYNAQVKNVGSADAPAGSTSVVFTLGNGTTYQGFSGSGWSCTDDAQEVSCDYAPAVEAGANAATLSIQAGIQPAARPSVTASATVTTTDDRNQDNDTDEHVVSVTSPDLGVSSSHTGDFRVGTVGTYTLDVKNHGDAATDAPIQITDTVPTGLSIVSANGAGWTCAIAAPDVTCDHTGPLAADAAAAPIALKVMPTTGAVPSVSNEVAVTGAPDFNAVNDSNSDFTVVKEIDIAVDLDGPVVTKRVGDDISYKVLVTNVDTADTIAPITVTGTLPTGVEPNEAGGNGWNCHIAGQDVTCDRAASLASAQDAPDLNIDALITPDAGSGSVSFDVDASTVDDVDAANDTSDTIVTPIDAGPDAVVSLNAAIPENLEKLRVGSNGVYHVKVSNIGGLPTEVGTKVKVNLPEGLDPGLSGSNDWPCYVLGQDITCTFVPAIPAGESTPSFPINFTVDSKAASTVTTDAEVEIENDLNPLNNTTEDEQEIDRTDVGVSVAASGDWVRGSTGQIKVTASNAGNGKTVAPIKVSTDLPAGITYNAVAGDGWACNASGLNVTCTRDAMLAGGTDAPVITITANIGASSVDQSEVQAAVSTEGDDNAANDKASTKLTIKDPLAPEDVVRVATVKSKKVSMKRNGTVPVSLACPADATVKCTGSLALQSAGKLKIGKAKRKVATKKVNYSIAPGRSYPVVVKFAGKAKQAIRLKRNLKVTATSKPTTSGLAPSKAKLTLKAR
ncbi:MAG: PKD domain-containing protein [Solirubrobacterales bacterium]|nr:PKD domain-containing protein [Solirubrobacterales bacterium]